MTIDPLSLRQWYGAAKNAAHAAAVDVFELDWLLGELLGIDRLSLRLGSFPATVGDLAVLDDLWERRLRDRIPVQYLVGHVHWRGMRLKVSPAVLIPRPETELLIDLVRDAAIDGPLVDLGTGSGAIAIGLAQALPNLKIHAVDCSEAALEIARENAEALGFGDRITFYQGSWCEPIAHLKAVWRGLSPIRPIFQAVTWMRCNRKSYTTNLGWPWMAGWMDWMRFDIWWWKGVGICDRGESGPLS